MLLVVKGAGLGLRDARRDLGIRRCFKKFRKLLDICCLRDFSVDISKSDNGSRAGKQMLQKYSSSYFARAFASSVSRAARSGDLVWVSRSGSSVFRVSPGSLAECLIAEYMRRQHWFELVQILENLACTNLVTKKYQIIVFPTIALALNVWHFGHW